MRRRRRHCDVWLWRHGLDRDLTVTGANTGEHSETQNSRIRLKQAVFETPANTGESNETNSSRTCWLPCNYTSCACGIDSFCRTRRQHIVEASRTEGSVAPGRRERDEIVTYYDAYIGNLEDPTFFWGREGVEGSPPRRISPHFPPLAGWWGG